MFPFFSHLFPFIIQPCVILSFLFFCFALVVIIIILFLFYFLASLLLEVVSLDARVVFIFSFLHRPLCLYGYWIHCDVNPIYTFEVGTFTGLVLE